MSRWLFVLLITSRLFAWEDLGVIGSTYLIQEPDLNKQLKSGIKDMNRSKIAASMRHSLRESMQGNAAIQRCSRSRIFQEEVPVRVTHYGVDLQPYTPQMKHPKRAKHAICFIDGRDAMLIKKSSSYEKIASCDKIVVANYPFKQLASLFPASKLYPSTPQLIDLFHVQCQPARIDSDGRMNVIEEIALETAH